MGDPHPLVRLNGCKFKTPPADNLRNLRRKCRCAAAFNSLTCQRNWFKPTRPGALRETQQEGLFKAPSMESRSKLERPEWPFKQVGPSLRLWQALHRTSTAVGQVNLQSHAAAAAAASHRAHLKTTSIKLRQLACGCEWLRSDLTNFVQLRPTIERPKPVECWRK